MASLLILLALAGDLDAAEKALAAGDADRAIDLLGELPDAEDAPPRVFLILGRAQAARGHPELAVEPLLRAADAMPEDKGVAREAALACTGAAEGDPGAAGQWLLDARRMAERAGDPLLLGGILLSLGEYEAAVTAFDRAAALPEGKLPGLQGKADALDALGRTEEAKPARIAALEEAMRLLDLAAAYRAAFACDQGGRFLDWLDGLVKEKPDDLRLRRYRGFTRSRLLLYREAAEDLRFVGASRPDDLAARNELVRVLLNLLSASQDTAAQKEAEVIATEIVRRAAGDPGSREALATARENLLWMAQRRWQAAELSASLDLLRVLHETDPEDVPAGLNLAAVARRLDLREEARRTYDRLLEAWPDDPDVLNDLGIFVDGLGRREEAVSLWKKVLEQQPENLDALENLFTSAWEGGDRAAAADYAARGLRAAERRRRTVDRWHWFQDRLLWAPVAWGVRQ